MPLEKPRASLAGLFELCGVLRKMTCTRSNHPSLSRFGRVILRALTPCLLCVACAVFLNSSLRAQNQSPSEAGAVSAKLETGYARLVFSFAHKPSHNVNSSTLNGGVLVLKFDQPVDVGLNAVTEKLPNYITSIRQDPDGKSLRFALARKIRVNTMEAGNDLYVDLLPEPWFGATPALPAAVLADLMRQAQEEQRLQRIKEDHDNRAASLGPVEVKVSEAPTFTRLEFLWRDKVPASLKRTNDRLDIIFDRIGDINLGPIKAHMPRFVEDISVSEADARMSVSLKIDNMRDVRLFEEGNAVYIDIQGPQRGAKEFKIGGSITESKVPILAPAGPGLVLYGQNPGQPPSEQAPSGQSSSEQAQIQAPEQSFLLSAQQQAVQLQPEEPKNKLPLQKMPAVMAEQQKPKDQQADILVPDVSSLDGIGQRIVFPFKNDTAAAIFQRGQTLWMIFVTGENIDTKPIVSLLERKLRRLSVDYKDKLAIMRLELEAPLLVSAATLDTSWLVTLGDKVAGRSDPAELKAHVAPDGRDVVNGYMNRAVAVQRVQDPAAGDELVVVLAMGPPIGLIKPQNFIDFTAFATTQGAALQPHVDDLNVRLDDIGFIVERPGSMAVSVALAPRSAEIHPGQVQNSFGFIDFENWKLGAPDEFYKIKQALIDRTAMEEGPARNAARLDLARFYIAYELGPEAVSVLNLVAKDDPATERELSFHIVRGVANIMSGRYEEAEHDLSNPLLDDNSDVAIWRGLIAAARKDWKLARRYLEKAQSVMLNYPRPLQAKIMSNLALATIELNDLVNTDALLDEALHLVGNDAGQAEVTLLRGRFNEAVGRYDVAIGFYKQIDVQRQPQFGVEASLRMIVLQERLGLIARDTAIKQLEALSFFWRGDDLELQIYSKLGDYLEKSDQFRAAFSIMRNANLANPASEISRELYDKMRIVFTSLFLDGKADDMPALEALSLFYDFRELVPAGRLGDQIIRGLAERLVDVDLLDQAIDLFSHQVDHRLNGMLRAEVGTELALVYLMNREPQKALSVLHRTRQATMPEDLEKRRTLFEARALAGAGRPELAIELLQGDGPEVMRLRADILWEGKSWKLCGEAFEKLLGERWQNNNPLSAQERNDVMRGALAYALAEDQKGVGDFRSKFMRLMEDTNEAHMFDVATGPIEQQGIEFRTLARSLASIDSLQEFWQTYRPHYKMHEKKNPLADAKPPTSEAKDVKNPA
jgi:tetratricopeptide (TPR) repeat protein